jgi:hypothetical protein
MVWCCVVRLHSVSKEGVGCGGSGRNGMIGWGVMLGVVWWWGVRYHLLSVCLSGSLLFCGCDYVSFCVGHVSCRSTELV